MRPAAAALLVAMTATGAAAAVVRDRAIDVRLDGGAVIVTEKLEIAIESAADARALASYPIPLDRHVVLDDCTAELLGPDGRVKDKVPRRRHQRVDSTGDGLYTSAYVDVVPWPALQPGDVQRLAITTRITPYFPSLALPLRSLAATDRLVVRARGLPGLRHRVDASAADAARVRVAVDGEGFALQAQELAGPSDAPLQPDDDGPVLRLAWGPATDWAGVAAWYEALLAGLPRADDAIARLAAEITKGAATPRARLEALARHVKGLRYVAVEIGAGGYVPTPAAKVEERRWGDCKDKAELLRALCAASDIDARLALLRAGRGARIDTLSPSPEQMNHCIVAVAAASVGATASEAPDGWLFVDATVDRGGAAWLPQADQGAQALVVDGAHSRLVTIPVRPDDEGTTLLARGAIDAEGTLRATMTLTARGGAGAAWIEAIEGDTPAQVEDDVRAVVTGMLPQAVLEKSDWRAVPGDVPVAEVTATLRLDGALRGEGDGRSLAPPLLDALPEPQMLDEREVPAAIAIGRRKLQLTLALPAGGCAAVTDEAGAANALGRVSTTVAGGKGEITVTREVEIRKGRIEPADFPLLRELCVAERRGDRQRVRLRCP